VVVADGRVVVVEPGGQGDAGAERQRDRGQGNAQDGTTVGADAADVHLPADEEHEEQNSHLRDGGEVRPDSHRKYSCRQMAGQQSQQARAQRDAGDDLGDDLGLAQPPEEGDQRRARDQDERHVGNGVSEQRSGVLGHDSPRVETAERR
jgi:hypothetical protein